MSRYFLYALLIALVACQKVTYYPDVSVSYEGTKKLAHRGGRTDSIRENTFEGCIHALTMTDGIEVDVQISKDRTIWLSHSGVVESCGTELRCFAETNDAEIANIRECNGIDYSYTRLEDVMKYMDENNIRKYISIDMKGWAPCDGTSVNVEAIMELETEIIIQLAEKYNLVDYILIENSLASVLNHAEKKNKRVISCLVSYGDYEKALLLILKHNFDAISFKADFADELKAEHIRLLHKKGKRMMTWNIADSSRMHYFESIEVDFIQIDL